MLNISLVDAKTDLPDPIPGANLIATEVFLSLSPPTSVVIKSDLLCLCTCVAAPLRCIVFAFVYFC